MSTVKAYIMLQDQQQRIIRIKLQTFHDTCRVCEPVAMAVTWSGGAEGSVQ